MQIFVHIFAFNRIIRTFSILFFSQRLQLFDDDRDHKCFDYKIIKFSKLNNIHVKIITSLCIVVKLIKLAHMRRVEDVRNILLGGETLFYGIIKVF